MSKKEANFICKIYLEIPEFRRICIKLEVCIFTKISVEVYHIYQPHHSGKIWHMVNF